MGEANHVRIGADLLERMFAPTFKEQPREKGSIIIWTSGAIYHCWLRTLLVIGGS